MAQLVAAAFRFARPPERIFISINESTGRSTISFAPSDASNPIVHEGDPDGAAAKRDAKTISETYPSATTHGPFAHAAPPPGRSRSVRKRFSKPSGDHE